MCEDWEVLLEGDYESAMILPIKKRYGITHLSQPYLAKQLGIFSNNNISTDKTQDFLYKLPGKIQWARLSMNKFNRINSNNWIEVKQKVFELDLILQVDKLSRKFSGEILNMISEGQRKEFSLIKDISPNDFIKLWRKDTRQKHMTPTSKENALRRILAKGIQHRACNIYGVFSKFNNLICCGVFFSFQRKITLLLSVREPEDKNYFALVWMIHEFIQENAGENLTLRFELPENQNRNFLAWNQEKQDHELSNIFTGFGAQTFHYPIIESRQTSIWVKLIKHLL